MHVGIIGAGFGGLAAGYRLAQEGVGVTIFESDKALGGLAVGFKERKWKWSLERHYHHWFSSDWAVRNLAQEIGHKVIFTRPKTSTFINGNIHQLDSPLNLLLFPEISLFNKLKMAGALFYLKSTSFNKKLENITAKDFIIKFMGKSSWKILWQPLFEKKFSYYSNRIPASWFWARIKKRSASLGYPIGGFLSFAESLEKSILKRKGKVYYRTKVEEILGNNGKIIVSTEKERFSFDKVICTIPSALFVKIVKDLPQNYIDRLLGLRSIGAINLLISLKKTFMEEGTYWLNVSNKRFPFVSVVEHTNFMDKKNYNNENLIYIGNYLPHEHNYYKMESIELYKEFYPFLKTINPRLDNSWVNDLYLFKAPFSQPIITKNYSEIIPDFKTPIEGLFLSNISQVYPWDRGTNYAVENGEKVAKMVLK